MLPGALTRLSASQCALAFGLHAMSVSVMAVER